MTDQLFLSTLRGTKSRTTPIWMMRQAGRYLEEYRKIRANQTDFISFCLNPEQASAVTLQPIARYDLQVDCQYKKVTSLDAPVIPASGLSSASF